jgi:hypothetical protein
LTIITWIIVAAYHLSNTNMLPGDYWDAAEELYEKLPVLGGLMRWLKRAANK